MNINKKDLIPVQALLVPKPILYMGRFLNMVSPFLASRFAASLFVTPFGYKKPKREMRMYEVSKKEKILIKKINREVVVYTYGAGAKRVLLSHGWSGTGTQLSSIAEELLKIGYSTVSFDAPAHGDSAGKKTIMPHFIETMHQLEDSHGPFEAAIGHSLGGMALLRATKNGLGIKKLIVVGTANSITNIIKDFAKNMQMSQKTATLMKSYFDNWFGEDLDNYSGSVSAEGVKIPTLVIHDKDDVDVHYSAAHQIIEKLEKGELLLTEKLGHRKILGDPATIKKMITYVTA